MKPLLYILILLVLLLLGAHSEFFNSIHEFWDVKITDVFLALFTGLLFFATVRLWQSTDQLVKGAEINSNRQLRAYVSVITGACVPQDITTGWKYEIRMFIKNNGQTPAHEVNFAIKTEILDFPLADDVDLTLPKNQHKAAGHLASGEQPLMIRAHLEELVTDETIQEIKIGSGRKLYVYGTVWYKDIFGVQQHTNFCQWALWDLAGNFSTINTLRHNDAT